MYQHLQHFLLQLEPAASTQNIIDVPWECPDGVSQLTAWVYTRSGAALPTGSLTPYINGAAKTVVNFAANMVAAPVYLGIDGPTDLNAFAAMALIPPTVQKPILPTKKLVATAGSPSSPTSPSLPNSVTSVKGPSIAMRVTNSSTSKVELVFVWTGVVWRP